MCSHDIPQISDFDVRILFCFVFWGVVADRKPEDIPCQTCHCCIKREHNAHKLSADKERTLAAGSWRVRSAYLGRSVCHKKRYKNGKKCIKKWYKTAPPPKGPSGQGMFQKQSISNRTKTFRQGLPPRGPRGTLGAPPERCQQGIPP